MDGWVVVIGGMGVFDQREEGLKSGVGCVFILAFFGLAFGVVRVFISAWGCD